MADDFGLKIGLECEKEFKKALAEINQSFKVLGSEMKLVESQFSKNDNSLEALTARNQVLNKEIEAQKQKIEALRQALANAAESFGENDRRTQAWQIQLNNAQAALNSMERELADNESAMDALGKEMDDTGDSADDLEEELDDAGDAADDSEEKFSKLGGTLKTVGVAMGAVVAAAAVSLGKAVVEAYGEYEQLVGGIDTLFKDSSTMMQEYDVVAGTFLIVGLGEEDFTSLTPEHMKQFKEKFNTPEMFIRLNGKLVVLPMEDERVKAKKPSVLQKLNDMKATDAPTAGKKAHAKEER